MKSLKFLKFFIICFFLLWGNVLSQIENSIIAKVGNQIITSLDVENEIKTILLLTDSEVTQENINVTKKAAVQTLVSKAVKNNEIKKYKIKLYSVDDLKSYLESVATNLNVEEGTLKKLFILNQVNYENFVESYKTELLWNTLIYKIYNTKLSLNPIEIENIIKKEMTKNETIKEFKLSEIEFSLKEDGEFIKKVYKTINEEGFGNAAKKYSISASSSNNGSIGWLSERSINKTFLNEINKLKTNEVTRPIQYLETKVIFKLDKLKNQKNNDSINIDQLKNNIVSQMKIQKLDLFSRSHFTNIKNQTLVKFK